LKDCPAATYCPVFTKRQFLLCSGVSVIRGNPEDLCSGRAFLHFDPRQTLRLTLVRCALGVAR
jgi:hypothetical protein